MEDFKCHPQLDKSLSLDLHLKWHYLVLNGTSVINMCGTYDRIELCDSLCI